MNDAYSLRIKNKRISEPLMRTVFAASALIAILAVGLICVFLFAGGLPAMGKIGIINFLTGTNWAPTYDEFGILPMIVGSIYVTAGAIIFGVPIGLFAAVFMARTCPKVSYRFLKPALDLLAGIPSVVYGFFGMVVLVPFVRNTFGGRGSSILTASLLLGIMILPTIISVSESALRAVPQELYEGAVALGASHQRAVFGVVLPAAKSGVMAAIVLGVGRAIGETMAVKMVVGNQIVLRAPYEFLMGTRTLTANVVLEMGYAEGLHSEALVATGVVLFVFILLINLLFSTLSKDADSRKKTEAREKRAAQRAARRASRRPAESAAYVIADSTRNPLRIDESTVVEGSTGNPLRIGSRLKQTLRGMQRHGSKLRSNARATAMLRKLKDVVLRDLTWLCTVITFAVLVFVIVHILIKGIPYLKPSLFEFEYTPENVSLFPALLTTIETVALSLIIAVPLGVFSAIYLVEYARRGNRFVKLVRSMAETLSGIPSIIYGLFGSLFFVTALGWGYSLLAGSCTLSIMILPLIMRTTEESLKAVPDTYREGSFGLGAGRLRTVFKIVLPAAAPGVLSGVILSIGRIVGETAALIYTLGNASIMTKGLFSSGRTLSLHMYALTSNALNFGEAYATAVVLLVVVIGINALSATIARRVAK